MSKSDLDRQTTRTEPAFLVGALVSLLTGRSMLYSGFRQMGLGAAAAAVIYAVGTVIGVGAVG